MKKLVFLMLLGLASLVARATEPPEAMKLHYRNGNESTVAFTAFKHLKFSGNNLMMVSNNGAESVVIDSIGKITFGQKQQEEPSVAMIPVTFAAIAVGSGSGMLNAYVMENGEQTRTLSSGDEVAAGSELRFKAIPNAESKVKGWRIDGDYQTTEATEQTVVLDENQHANGLHVEAEFVKSVGAEESEASQALSVYVQEREIIVESAAGIERVELLDMSGRVLTNISYKQQPRVAIPVGQLKAGLYLLKTQTTQKEETRKVIIR